jgi:hypothetical protein
MSADSLPDTTLRPVTVQVSRTNHARLSDRQARVRVQRDRAVSFNEIIGDLLDQADQADQVDRMGPS